MAMDDTALGKAATKHRFFKGCTRPAMVFGVPLVPLLLVSGVFLMAAMWAFYLLSPYVSLILMLVFVPLITVMRQMTKQDDQRLRQVLLRARMRFRHANKQLWGAISYSPLRYKKRRI
jgi:type IV secretion system protein VirB3